MNMKRICLFLLLVSVVAVGVVFAQRSGGTISEARSRGYSNGYNGSGSSTGDYDQLELNRAYEQAYREGMDARQNNQQGSNNPFSISTKDGKYTLEPHFRTGTEVEYYPDGSSREYNNTELGGNLRIQF